MVVASTALAVGLLASVALFAMLAPLFRREINRIQAFDKRLATLRREVAEIAPRTRGTRRLLVNPWLGALSLAVLRGASVLVPVGASEREKLAIIVRRAGFARRDALALFLSVKLFSALTLAASAGLAAVLSDLWGGHWIAVSFAMVVGFVIGSVVPEYVLRILMNQRLRKMSVALPDALDLMMMCLDSGLTFERALATTADHLGSLERSLAHELRLLDRELRVASNRRGVLEEYARLAPIEGLGDIAMTLMQSDRYGTPLSRSLRNIATNERLRRDTRLTAQAERLPVLMTLPTLLLVVPGTMLLVAGPAFVNAVRALGALGGQ